VDLVVLLSWASPVVAGAAAYGAGRRRFGRPVAALVAIGCALAAGLCFWLASPSFDRQFVLLDICFAAGAGVVAYQLVRHDVSRSRAVLVTAGSAVLVASGFVLVLYLAPAAFLAAAAVYWVTKRVVRINHALLASALTLAALLTASVATFYVAVGAMS
jgi:hypothetical protein